MSGSALKDMRILISGAGVGGPALAFWLARRGAEVTVVERAPALRTGGSAVDFRGPTHLGVLELTGVLQDLRELQTHGGAMRFVDKHGRQTFELPTDFAGGDVEVYRGDLSRVLYQRSLAPDAGGRVDYVFGDTLTGLTETADAVHAVFEKSADRRFDLVIGADGMHSAVRRLAFGPEEQFVHNLGYCISGWDLPNHLGLGSTALHYNVPGRMAAAGANVRDPGQAKAVFVFATKDTALARAGLDRQKQALRAAFGGLGWQVPALLDSLDQVTELYFDAIARTKPSNYTSGRIALLGDAAWGVTLGGMGVGTAVVGAYVLAGELASAGGEHRTAFAKYEQRMHGYAGRWRKSANPGKFLAPGSRAGLWTRDALFKRKAVQRMLVSSTKSVATEHGLPQYPEP
ncbi:FAD-dependent monooxygenase [Catenulispora sp. NL8]|uniref:FAD-dependent monooxygenase n=1 Tax=Catenulispora pinistramenti TaxID=2705254 RepID=A0ABS5KRU6_9ACTN|nr:FAD-dependent monooxygenase [Catenulispora pinistramenti]MBS2548739.1 FAD-dependent monooxygenase [Catenulispora pinistramenti]